jgi:peptidoglycan/LPS O-acetylase OafA/YrhL
MNTAHDPLDDLLRRDAAELRADYIDDAGFSARVVDALPARRRGAPVLRIVPHAFTAAAAIVVLCCSSAGYLVIDAAMDLATETITANALGMLLVIAVVMLLSLGALSSER